MNMKQFLIEAFFALSATYVSAQDVIVKKDGNTILSKVLEVNTSDIKYKKFSNQNGPTYTINKSEIMSINYENGEKDDFSINQEIVTPLSTSTSMQYGLIKKEPADNNADILKLYNFTYQPTKKLKPKNKECFSGIAILGIKSTSVMSNEDLEIRFRRHIFCNYNNWEDYQRFYIEIINKSDKTIYIDKGNCFKIGADGNSYCYYDPSKQKTVNEGGGVGGSIGLGSVAGALGVGGIVGQVAGGVNLSAGTSRTVSTTYNSQRFVAIPPRGKKNLTEDKQVKTKDGSILGKAEYSSIESSESFYISLKLNTPIYYGHSKFFSENELPWTTEYLLTYSSDPNFTTYSQLNIQLFIQEIIGCNLSFVNYAEIVEKYVEGINEFSINGSIDWGKGDPFDVFFR